MHIYNITLADFYIIESLPRSRIATILIIYLIFNIVKKNLFHIIAKISTHVI